VLTGRFSGELKKAREFIRPESISQLRGTNFYERILKIHCGFLYIDEEIVWKNAFSQPLMVPILKIVE